MRRLAVAGVLISALLAGRAGWAEALSLAYQVRATVLVQDADKAGRALAGWAETVGGYFVSRSLDAVVMRVPAARVSEIRAALEGTAEVVLSYEPATQDVREEIATVASAITSREESLALILGYIDKADVKGTLALEKELSGLLVDIEGLKGRKQRLENDASFARVEVGLSSRRQTVPTQRASSFAWINTVSLYRFLQEVLPHAQ